jgi:DNA-binding winged helix-turn-helix (wHTH) protein
VQQQIYRFGEFQLDESLLELRRQGEVVEIQPKPFFLILYLLRHRDRVVGREELMRELWPDVAVSEASLTTALHEARRALDDKDPDRRVLATLRGRGYRFMGSVEESGVEPPELATKVLAPQAALDQPQAPAPSADASPFVDRESEMEQLRAVLVAALGGERRVVLLQGPPGIGKTRLAAELALDAARSGFDVHVGRAHEGDGAPPFWPWIQILRSFGEVRSALDLRLAARVAAPDLVRLVPELRPKLGEPSPPIELRSEQGRFRMLDSVTGFLRSAARARPLLLVLDDLHWADEASLALLVFLARGVIDAPLAIVGTHRPVARTDAARDQALGRVLREPGTASLALSGLESSAVESILGRTLGRAPTGELLERVRAITGGNPFFVAELARLLASRGAEVLHGRAPLPIPERLRDTVRIRVGECSDVCQKLLRASSVIGTRFALPLLRRATDLSGEQLIEALAEAERSDLLYRDAAPGAYRFAHGVVRETLYEELGSAERMRLHRDIGEALEKLCVHDPTPFLAELAHHFAEAAALDCAEQAIHYARRAAARARAVSAHSEEADHCRRALQILEFLDAPSARLRCELLVELGEALEASHDTVEAVEKVAEEAIQLARALVDATLLARAAACLARHTGDKDTLTFFDAARAQLALQRLVPPIEEALLGLSDETDAELKVSTLLALLRLFSWSGDMERASALAAQAARLAEGKDDPVMQATVLAGRVETEPLLGRTEEGLAVADGIVACGVRAGRSDIQHAGQFYRIFVFLQSGDRDGANSAFGELERLVEGELIGEGRMTLGVWRSLVAAIEGRLDAADRETQAVAHLGLRFNFRPERATAVLAVQQWWISLLRGQPQTMLGALRGYLQQNPGTRYLRSYLARLYAELGRHSSVERELPFVDARALGQMPRDHQWLFIACLSAETCALIDDAERARAFYDLLTPYVDLHAVSAWITVSMGSVARPLGALAATLGLWTEAEELFELALARNEAMRAPALVVWTQIDYARALLRHPRPRERSKGQRILDAAARAAEPLGMSAALERARRARV